MRMPDFTPVLRSLLKQRRTKASIEMESSAHAGRQDKRGEAGDRDVRTGVCVSAAGGNGSARTRRALDAQSSARSALTIDFAFARVDCCGSLGGGVGRPRITRG